MTIEHKLIVSLDEIKSVVLECTQKECNSRAVFSPDRIDTLPTTCPHGHRWSWEVPDMRTQLGSPIMSWLQLLRRLRDPMNQNCGFKIFLEFEEPVSGREAV